MHVVPFSRFIYIRVISSSVRAQACAILTDVRSLCAVGHDKQNLRWNKQQISTHFPDFCCTAGARAPLDLYIPCVCFAECLKDYFRITIYKNACLLLLFDFLGFFFAVQIETYRVEVLNPWKECQNRHADIVSFTRGCRGNTINLVFVCDEASSKITHSLVPCILSSVTVTHRVGANHKKNGLDSSKHANWQKNYGSYMRV